MKYRSDKPRLCFSAKQEKGRATLFVQDNGIGIEEGDLPRIFDKGFTGKNGRNAANSTGIGLYLCRRLCQKLGICISAESDLAGTTIMLSFSVNDFIHQVGED